MISNTQFIASYQTAFTANGLSSALYLSPAVVEKFHLLTEELLRCNTYMNLTAITAPEDIIIKHYVDCALAADLIPQHASLADIGTGAGFPSLPFAILRPDITITAIDATQKKLDYVASVASLLGLTNLTVHSARAEELGRESSYRETFDIVSARAVARMNILAEWCLPLVKKGGYFLAMKGKAADEESAEAAHAIDVLGGVIETSRHFTLTDPFSQTDDQTALQRCLILVRKRQFTPKQYPRTNAQISKKPL